MTTRADDLNRALDESINREKDACLRAQRLSYAVVALGASVAGYAAGMYTAYRLMERRGK
ncbi:MAG: hypothetical protein IPK80_19715 [Nannocystis sp.]|nr:hypothetical protein [Nannocystis sp.]MBK8263552.1 hypothetical protein [Nannocystis sp.]